MGERDTTNLSKQVEELKREQQQILSIISHDLRSPLNRVFALVELLEMSTVGLSPDQKTYLEKIHITIADGLAMMTNLVDYRNIEYRDIDLDLKQVNVSDLVLSRVKRFAPIAEIKYLEILTDCQDNLVAITDSRWLTRSIDNLLANAVKFSPKGKKIWVRAHALSPDQLKIEVQDEAQGFTTDEISLLFQKFQKFSAQPTGGESKTGLGLFVANAMIEKLGGKLTCTTKEKTGSTFSLELPKQSINRTSKDLLRSLRGLP